MKLAFPARQRPQASAAQRSDNGREPSPGWFAFNRAQRDLLFGGALLAILTSIPFFFQAGRSDFRMFYDSGLAWRTGGPLYTSAAPNLHPPAVVAALFAPLAGLPYRVAQIAWLLCSIAGLLFSVRLVARELDWSPHDVAVALALVLVTYASWVGWYQGQMTWILAYSATRSWLDYRHGRLAAAGMWFAPLIVVKPTLALVALCLPWRVWVPAAVVSAGASMLAILWTGLAPWRDWWAFRDDVFWISWPDNVSVWGLAVRLVTGNVYGGRLSDLPATLVVCLIAACAAAWWVARRERNADRRLALAWLAGTLVAPIGWVHYLPMGLAAFFSSGRREARIGFAILSVPFILIYPIVSGPMAPWVGSIYFAGTVCAFWAWTRPRGEHARLAHAPRA